METRTNWVVVLAAVGFAVLIIGAAFYFSSSSTAANTGSLAATQSTSEPTDNAEWRAALAAIAESAVEGSLEEYRAPAELGTTQSISQELLATYVKLKGENKLNTPEADAELQKLIARNVTTLAPADTYTLASVITNQTVTLEEYAGSIGSTMEKSAAVKEYELAAFARTVGKENITGTPALAATASVYKIIEQELIATPVPPQLATEHLTVVKSIAFLAQSTELMASWAGDPLDALTYVDGFVRAEREVRASFDALFAAMIKVGKQS